VTAALAGLMNLTGAGARAVMWLYFASIASLALSTLGGIREPWRVVLALVLFGGLTLAATIDRSDRLSLPVTVFALAVGPVNAVLIAWQLPYVGYNTWFIGAGATSLFLLCLRGRIGLAWVGFALLAVVVLVWGATTPWLGILGTAGMLGRQGLVVVVGTLFALGLRRSAAEIDRLTAATAERAATEAAELAETAERARRHAELAETVEPLLRRIASGAPASADDRREFGLAEAELRDSLRAKGLRMPAVTDAARAARRRGVDVVLLDDSGADGGRAGAGSELESFATIVAETLDGTTDGRVTARLLPPGRAILGTVVADGSTYRKHEVHRSSTP